jgi:hypothetical protein
VTATQTAAQPRRPLTVELPRNAPAAAAALSASRFPEGATAAVLAPDHPLLIAVAAPVAAVLDAPRLIVLADSIPPETQAELDRLAPTRIVSLTEPAPRNTPPNIDAIAIASADDDLGTVSCKAAAFVRAHAGTVRAFAIGDTELSHGIACSAGAAAALRKFPIMLGTDAARRGAMEGERRAAVTYLIAREAIAGAAQVPGGFPLPAPTDDDVAARVLQLLLADGIKPRTIGIVGPDDGPLLAAVLAACGGPVVRDAGTPAAATAERVIHFAPPAPPAPPAPHSRDAEPPESPHPSQA